MKNRFAILLVPLIIAAAYAADRASSRGRADHTASASLPPAAASTPVMQIDSFFATIADGDDDERHQAIDRLHHLLNSGDPEVRKAAVDYPYLFHPLDRVRRAHQPRSTLLLRAIPRLIAEVDGSATDAAYRILIYIQPYNPPPDRATWENWWQETGRAKFAAMAGSSASPNERDPS